MVSMASYTLMSIVDSIFVARLGTSELAAVGLAASALYLCTSFWVGLLGAVRILVAQATGAGRPDDARRVAWHGLFVAMAAGLVVVGALPWAPHLLTMFGASPDVTELGLGYLQVRLAGSSLVFLVIALQGWFQGRGDTRTPMVAVLLGNAVNIGLDAVLIHGLFGLPALGVSGAGIATVAAWAIQLVWLARHAQLGEWVSFERRRLRRLFSVGAPMGTHIGLDVAAYGVFSVMLAGVGEAHVAAHVVVVRVLMTSFLPGHAVGEATGVLVGRAVGAGEFAHARRAWASGSWVAGSMMTMFGAVFLLVPGWLVVPFGADPDVVELVVGVLMLAGSVQVFDALGMVALGALNGAGDTRFSMLAGLSATWLVKVPLGAVGVYLLDLGVLGAWLGVAAELVLLAGLAVSRVRGGAWLEHRDVDLEGVGGGVLEVA